MAGKKLKIKVCGMRDSENIRKLIRLKPDFIGFILYPESKRFVGEDYKFDVEMPESIHRVGVFVNALLGDVIHWVNRLGLDYVQLHGDEPVAYCSELTDMNIHVIKAFGIHENFNFDSILPYYPYCKYILFDTKSSAHGGTGKKFDWNILSGYNFEKPLFLSGGIGPEDIQVIQLLKKKIPIYAVDINSRFEISPGLKDIKMLKPFFSTIRNKNF